MDALQPIGIPLLYFIMLRNNRTKICPSEGLTEEEMIRTRKDDESLAHIRPLFESFRPSAMYFEVIDAVRRIVLSATIGFMGPAAMRSIIGYGIAFCFLEIQRHVAPYPKAETNALASMAASVLTVAFLFAFIIISRPFAYNELIIGLILLFGNLWLVVMGICCVTGTWEKLGYFQKGKTATVVPVGNEIKA